MGYVQFNDLNHFSYAFDTSDGLRVDGPQREIDPCPYVQISLLYLYKIESFQR